MSRVALDWKVAELAERAGVMPNMVSNFELGRGALVSTAKVLEQALLASRTVRFGGDSCVCVEGHQH